MEVKAFSRNLGGDRIWKKHPDRCALERIDLGVWMTTKSTKKREVRNLRGPVLLAGYSDL